MTESTSPAPGLEEAAAPPPSPIAVMAAGSELYRLIVENVLDYAIFALDLNGRVVSWNDGAERMTGHTEREIVGRPLAAFYPGEDVRTGKPEQALREAATAGQSKSEGWWVRKDGARLWASAVVTVLRDEAGTPIGFSVINRDLTDRREIAQRYEESRQRYRSLLENNPDAVFSFGLDGRIDSVNPASLAVCGYAEAELLGRFFMELVVPDQRGRLTECLLQAAQGEPKQLETAMIHRDGRRVEASLTVVPIVVGDDVLGLYAIADDITERIRAEAERAELLSSETRARAEAERANRSKGDFLAVMSHELRTPLNVINGYTELLDDEVPGPLTLLQKKHLGRIRASSNHLLSLINEILSYTRMEEGHEGLNVEPADLCAVGTEVAGALDTLAAAKRIRTEIQLPTESVWLATDPQKVRQILLNLLTNAVKFTDPGGSVALRLALDGTTAVWEVRDTGVGIAADHLDRIWEPFWQGEQSASRRAEGTGLGLTVVRRLVELLGGEISVRSEPGTGTAFLVSLPGAPATP